MITLQNKIRFVALLQCFGALAYVGVSQSIPSSLSWLHSLHLVLDPLIFIATLLDSAFFASTLVIGTALLTAADALVLIANTIAVRRCLTQASAACLTIVLEDSLWITLAAVHTLLGLYMTTQLYRLYGANMRPPKYDPIVRARIVYTFQLVPDTFWYFVTQPSGIELLGAVHYLTNPLGVWMTYRRMRTSMLAAAIGTLAIDVIVLVLRTPSDDFAGWMARIYSYVYILLDIMLIIFTTKSKTI